MEKTDRHIVLVTGGAIRIGRAISLAFAKAGFGVVVHCNRSRAEAEMLRDEIARDGGVAWVVTGDLADSAACDSVVASAIASAGRLDVLVNNASIFARTPLPDATAADFEAQWRVNTLAPALLSRAFARAVIADAEHGGAAIREARKNGAPFFQPSIVNLLDQRIANPRAGCIPYALSKSALAAFTEAAAIELAPRVAVNAVAPGAVASAAPHGGVHEKAGATLLESRPTPDDIAAAVVWLATARGVTGQTVFVDAGQRLI